ncbi:MAG: glycosyltransferase, partial [Bacteroidales bacterium]|nr:glycosyltransferase [Bacteroidales bacterium]
MTNPLLSIIIPTKDRYDTLIPVVDSFLNHIAGDDYEIVVQDNSGDNSRWLQYAKGRQDEKVKYFYDAVQVSIKDNVNRAFENCCGQYIIFIGDDDFVSPYILDMVRMMKENGIENLVSDYARYFWKGSTFWNNRLPHHQEYAFWMPKQISTQLEHKDAKLGRKKTLLNGAINYENLPCVYHGITKNTVLKKIKEIAGEYVTGSSPDF